MSEREVKREPIVFYDGECGLCDRFVQKAIKFDREGILRFAPLQGDTAKELIGNPEGAPDSWTIIYYDEEGVWQRSTAALRILRRIHWAGPLPAIGLAVPKFIRDSVYRFVAKIRYRVFGKVDSCMLPPPAVRRRFLP